MRLFTHLSLTALFKNVTITNFLSSESANSLTSPLFFLITGGVLKDHLSFVCKGRHNSMKQQVQCCPIKVDEVPLVILPRYGFSHFQFFTLNMIRLLFRSYRKALPTTTEECILSFFFFSFSFCIAIFVYCL